MSEPTSFSSAASHGSDVPDALLDLRGIPCPINFVRTKLRLQQMEADQLLEVWIDSGEPVVQVPDSLKMEGYGVESLADQGNYYALRVRNSQP